MKYKFIRSEGFTLLEVAIALTIFGIFLAALFKLLNQSLKSFSNSHKNFETFLCLDNNFKLNKFGNLTILIKNLKEYNIAVRVYKCRNMEYIELLK